MPKRTYSGKNSRPSKRYKTGTTYYPRPTRGFTRTSGFYGRFRPLWRRGRGMSADYPERKFFDTTISNTYATNTGTIVSPSLNLVSLGNAQNQMIGRKIIIKRISAYIDAQLYPTANATAANVICNDTLRLMLIQDKQANGAAATIAQMFQNNDFLSFQNLENSNRFKILKQWCVDLNSPLVYDQGNSTFDAGTKTHFEKWSKKTNIRIDFGPQVGGTRAITEVRSNNLLIVGFTEFAAVALNYRFRIRYTDD